MRLEYGRTRLVVLVGQSALKFPRINEGFINFLLGLIHNINEFNRHKNRSDLELARVRWCAPFGLLLIMERLIPFHVGGWDKGEHMAVTEALKEEFSDLIDEGIAVDIHTGNFGYRLDGTLVCLDYGDIRRWH